MSFSNYLNKEKDSNYGETKIESTSVAINLILYLLIQFIITLPFLFVKFPNTEIKNRP